MQLRELGQISTLLANSPVFSDPLWSCEVSKVFKMDLTMFHARMAGLSLSKEAITALEVLHEQTILAITTGRLTNAPYLNHVIKAPRFAVDELVRGLGRLSTVRRQAALYALESQASPQETMQLTWSHVLRSNQATPLSIDLIRERNKLRHIRLPYVFWEQATERISTPLLNLKEAIEGAFERPWTLLMEDYRAILKIDSRAELQSFQELITGL